MHCITLVKFKTYCKLEKKIKKTMTGVNSAACSIVLACIRNNQDV